MKTLIIGKGEIGKSLLKTLSNYKCEIIDKDEEIKEKFEIMHICFPYSEKFIKFVEEYKKKYNPKYTIIHSTVPSGTSRKCDAIHSPVIGIHPHLEESLKTFTKYLSGTKASFVADYFRRAGIKVYLTDKQETTETIKALSTSFYGLMIEFTKRVKNICLKEKIPFEFWTIWTENYNKGYEKLGYKEYTRPNLTPILKEIGGHCILPNLKFVDEEIRNLILEEK